MVYTEATECSLSWINPAGSLTHEAVSTLGFTTKCFPELYQEQVWNLWLCGDKRTQVHLPAHKMPPGNIAQRDVSQSSLLLQPSGRSGGCRSTGQTVSAWANRQRRGGEGMPAPWEMPPQLCTTAACLNWVPKPLQRWLYMLREYFNLVSSH